MYSLPTGDDFYYGDASDYKQHLIDKLMGKAKSERIDNDEIFNAATELGIDHRQFVDDLFSYNEMFLLRDLIEHFLKRQEANGTEEEAGREASELMRLVTPFGANGKVKPFTIEWWFEVENEAVKKATQFDEMHRIKHWRGKFTEANEAFCEAKKYWAIRDFCRKRILQKVCAKKV